MTRALKILTRIGEGRVEATCSCEPSLRIDGVACCDQFTVGVLAHAGLFRVMSGTRMGDWSRAELTTAGIVALTEGAIEQ